MTKRTVGIIPARAGSKGLPGKNKRILAGQPLIIHTLNAAMSSNMFDMIIVSSDDKDIKSLLMERNDVNVVFDDRPISYSSDETEMFHVIRYLIRKYALENPDVITILQPTSPLRDSKDIKSAFKVFEPSKHNGLISVVETENTILKNCIVSNGYLEGVRASDLLFKNRQALPKTYKPNGAIYIYNVASLNLADGFHLENVVPFLMSDEKSADIDNLNDFEKIESKLI